MQKIRKKWAAVSVLGLLFILSLVCLSFLLIPHAQESEAIPLYSVSGKNSSVKYGSHYSYSTEKKGLVVSLAPGETFNYNRAVNLNGKTAEDVIISLFPTPLVAGTSDAHYLSVIFTDVYNPENTITVTCWDPWQDGWGADHFYMYTYPAGQIPAGRSTLDGTIHKNNSFGTEGLVSFSGQELNGVAVGSREIVMSFDYEERQLYGTKYTIDHPLVADYDNTDYFDEVWNGFTTGEVFISIEAGNYNMSTFNFVITAIDGNDLSETSFIPDRAPEITVDKSAFDKEIKTVVGKRFPFLPAKAFSIYDSQVKTDVRVRFGTEDIKTEEGAFTPELPGKYTVIYTATDKFGNQAVSETEVIAEENGGNLTLVLFGEKTELSAGKPCALADAFYFGGSVVGKVNLKVTATLSGGGAEYSVNPNNLIFTPEYAGRYIVRYEFSDYLGSGTRLAVVNVGANDSSYLAETPPLPDYFIKGATYALPDVSGINYATGSPDRRESSVYVSEDGGEETLLTGNSYTVTAENSVKVIYRAGSQEGDEEYSKTIKVIDVEYGGQLIAQNYFDAISGSPAGESDENRVFFNFAEDGILRFINSVQGQSFNTEFSLTGAAPESFDMYLFDSVNKEQAIKLSWFNRGDKTGFRINDGDVVYNLDSVFSGGNRFTLTYNNDLRTVSISPERSIRLESYLSGEEFCGFTSSLIYCAFGMSGVTESAELSIYRINNQAMYDFSADGDITRPELIVKTMRGERRQGDKITIYPAIIKDVLDPYVECSISVLGPDGTTFVQDVNGVTLSNITDYSSEYSYVLDEYGSYITTYVVKDGYLNQVRYGYQNVVVDMDEPALEIKGSVKSEAGIGDTVKLPKATAKDGDTELSVFIYVEAPDGEVYNVTESRRFTAHIAGIYRVSYYTVDEAGNMAQANYSVRVG